MGEQGKADQVRSAMIQLATSLTQDADSCPAGELDLVEARYEAEQGRALGALMLQLDEFGQQVKLPGEWRAAELELEKARKRIRELEAERRLAHDEAMRLRAALRANG